MIDYQTLIQRWRGGDLDAWARLLPDQLARGLSQERYGDLSRWLELLRQLPDLPVVRRDDDEVAGRRCDASQSHGGIAGRSGAGNR